MSGLSATKWKKHLKKVFTNWEGDRQTGFPQGGTFIQKVGSWWCLVGYHFSAYPGSSNSQVMASFYVFVNFRLSSAI